MNYEYLVIFLEVVYALMNVLSPIYMLLSVYGLLCFYAKKLSRGYTPCNERKTKDAVKMLRPNAWLDNQLPYV